MEFKNIPLLYTLVSIWTQYLGIDAVTNVHRINHTKSTPFSKISLVNKPNYLLEKKILLNLNGPPLVTKSSKANSVFLDNNCINCYTCMQRALKEYRTDLRTYLHRPTADDLHEELLNMNKKSLFKSRNKRGRGLLLNNTTRDEIMEKALEILSNLDKAREKMFDNVFEGRKAYSIHVGDINKLSSDSMESFSKGEITSIRGLDFNHSIRRLRRDLISNLTNSHKLVKTVRKKKSKIGNSITVTKYNINGRTYALRVKESGPFNDMVNSNETKSDLPSCQVYKIVNTFTCDSLDADLLLTAAKGKTKKNKKKYSRKNQKKKIERNTTSTTKKPLYHKREIITDFFKTKDVSKENYMSSLEELY